MLINVSNVSCSVPGRKLFSGLTFSLDKGESIAIVGESGSGKSTLLNAIMGIRAIDEGNIEICGESITTAPANEKLRLRREHIGIVYQDGQLIDELSAAENVALPLMLQPEPPHDPLKIASQLLDGIGVPSTTQAEFLSGGERQRTALMRALAPHPDIILADEPTGALDITTRDKIATELFSTINKRQLALVLVTHDPAVAARADSILYLSDFYPSSSK